MKTRNRRNQQSGFIVADFLFAMVLTISCGILIFGISFTLATIEISQYIVWSAARNYAAANLTVTATSGILSSYDASGAPFANAELQAKEKFDNLSKQFPLLTGRTDSPWFRLGGFFAGDIAKIDGEFKSSRRVGKDASDLDFKDAQGQRRQPWIGARADLELSLLKGFRIPFLGPVDNGASADTFQLQIYSFLLRHPSQHECRTFIGQKFHKGILELEPQFKQPPALPSAQILYAPIEDNGC